MPQDSIGEQLLYYFRKHKPLLVSNGVTSVGNEVSVYKLKVLSLGEVELLSRWPPTFESFFNHSLEVHYLDVEVSTLNLVPGDLACELVDVLQDCFSDLKQLLHGHLSFFELNFVLLRGASDHSGVYLPLHDLDF